jgi:hypothetical protein
MLKIDRLYAGLIRNRRQASWLVLGVTIFAASVNTSAWGLQSPMVTEVSLATPINTLPDEPTELHVAALYSGFYDKDGVTAADLAVVSLAASEVEKARTPAGAQAVAKTIITKEYNWNEKQFSCLKRLWTRESHWNFQAHNYRSGAHGIPQAYPAIKMEKFGLDWRSNPVTQIRWGLSYIESRYDNPCKALSRHNWRHSY